MLFIDKFGFCPEEFLEKCQIRIYVILRTLFVLSRLVKTISPPDGEGGVKGAGSVGIKGSSAGPTALHGIELKTG